MFRREQRGGDAQDGTAGDGPGCEPSGEPGGEEGAGERGGGGGGGWDSGEGSGRSDAVVVERGSRHNPGAGSGSMAKATAPSWDQAGEAHCKVTLIVTLIVTPVVWCNALHSLL